METCTEPCRCNCGYTCGGPGECELFAEDFNKCLQQHYKQDCDHKFDGKVIKISNGESTTCSICGLSAASHDFLNGI